MRYCTKPSRTIINQYKKGAKLTKLEKKKLENISQAKCFLFLKGRRVNGRVNGRLEGSLIAHKYTDEIPTPKTNKEIYHQLDAAANWC